MPYDVIVDASQMLLGFDAMEKQQFPFAASLAFNRTTEEVQDRLRLEVHAKLTTRTTNSAQFLDRMIKFDTQDHATKQRLATRIHIAGPEGEPQKAELLTRHIFGGVHTKPDTPLDAFYIPADASHPTAASIMPRNLYPRNLRLMDRRDAGGVLYAKRHVTRSGKVQLQGKQRTFVLTDSTGRPYGVFQREGPKDIQLLWFYTGRVNLSARFDFYGIARKTFIDRFNVNFAGMWSYALSTAR